MGVSSGYGVVRSCRSVSSMTSTDASHVRSTGTSRARYSGVSEGGGGSDTNVSMHSLSIKHAVILIAHTYIKINLPRVRDDGVGTVAEEREEGAAELARLVERE